MDHVRISSANANIDRKTITTSQSVVPVTKYTSKFPTPSQIPLDILDDPLLQRLSSGLPSNYNFEIPKTIWMIRKNGYKRIALQLPEGFQRYAILLSDLVRGCGGAQVEEVYILGDVSYGACCVEDHVAQALNCDYLVHYGHSCLVPVTKTLVPVLYIFVEIRLVCEPLIRVIEREEIFKGQKVALMATVQYLSVLYEARDLLTEGQQRGGGPNVFIPQIKPLSPGEVLGCTAPKLPSDTDALIFIADGRFHLEAAMIANPSIPAYRYDPFLKTVFYEVYDHQTMLCTRRRMIELAQKANKFGVIWGLLGRQGNRGVVDDLVSKLSSAGKNVQVYLMSEVRPEKLKEFPHVEAWVQTSCPRLSIDWNYAFGEDLPLLTPYELNVALKTAEPFWLRRGDISQSSESDCCKNSEDCDGGNCQKTKEVEGHYPMDFYATGDAAQVSGPWTPGYQLRPPKALVKHS